MAERMRTVRDLIGALEGCNPDAEVRIRIWTPGSNQGYITVQGAKTFRIMECNQFGQPTYIELDGRANGT